MSLAEVSLAPLYADLLAVPYLRHGRNKRGMDCLGLFMEVQRRFGRDIPPYPWDASALDLAEAEWDPCKPGTLGAGILMRWTSPPWHLGVVVGPSTMIHTREGAGVAVERFDGPLYRRRIEGFYQWRHAAPVPFV